MEHNEAYCNWAYRESFWSIAQKYNRQLKSIMGPGLELVWAINKRFWFNNIAICD